MRKQEVAVIEALDVLDAVLTIGVVAFAFVLVALELARWRRR